MEASRFWDVLDRHRDAIALIDSASGARLSYRQLAQAADRVADLFAARRKKLICLPIARNADSVAVYLGLLRAGHTVLLMDPDAGTEQRIVEQFMPDVVLRRADSQTEALPTLYAYTGSISGFEIFATSSDGVGDGLPGELCLLLATSGTMGCPRFSRLSSANVGVAATQVCRALDLKPADRAVTSLPLHHVYGLSVLHGQLCAGGSVVLTDRSVMDPRFWKTCLAENVTAVAGVPWTFSAMKTAGFRRAAFPHLRKVTQSGAKLDAPTLSWLLETFPEESAELYLMYGKTEAAGRIAVLPPGLARDNPDSVGFAVRGSWLECSAEGEIVYYGPNVMLGYASERADLSRGDELSGVLRTGDLGTFDSGGCLRITGRANRICKIFGERVSLDEVQERFQELGAAAAIGDDTQLSVFLENVPIELARTRADAVARALRIPRHCIKVSALTSLPRLPSGKISFSALQASASTGERQ